MSLSKHPVNGFKNIYNNNIKSFLEVSLNHPTGHSFNRSSVEALKDKTLCLRVKQGHIHPTTLISLDTSQVVLPST